MQKLLARKAVIKRKVYEQGLNDHILSVCKIASEIGKKINLKYTSIVLGLGHDLGKASTPWQDYLLSNGRLEMVTHSDVSSRFMNKLFDEYEVYDVEHKHIILYVITAHHGYYDNINKYESDAYNAIPLLRKAFIPGDSDGEVMIEVESFFESTKDGIEEAFGCDIGHIFKKSQEEMECLLSRIMKISKHSVNGDNVEYNYYLHLVIRLLLSILKEADIYDSSNAFKDFKDTKFSRDEKDRLWEESTDIIESLYKKFSKNKNPSLLNKVRTRLSEEAKIKAEYINKGIYKAELPTGSGKTLLTMRYALNASKKFNKDRIFYIAPFLSIVDQNAAEIRKLISNSDYLIEHHSNVISESNYSEDVDRERYEREQYLIDSWESPLIMTTMVQFTNTIFKGKASNIRRFCKLIDSTIILDEIQSIPDKVLYNFNLASNFISEVMNTTIIHCTATQPNLDSNHLMHTIRYGENNRNENLSEVLNSEKQVFKRVEAINLNYERVYSYSTEEISTIILEKYKEHKNALIICNTKSSVKKLYERLKENLDADVYYLTTNMCAAHRIKIIQEIKEKLKGGEQVICVSTQLVEAGVDIDFKVVFKTMSSISSLIQAAGRCNREGKFDKGFFYIFKYKEEKLSSLQEIKVGADITQEILLKMDKELIDLENLKNKYYSKLYANSDDITLSYRSRNSETTILDMLSNNKNIIRMSKYTDKSTLEQLVLKQSFNTAAIEFNLIDKSGYSVIAHYNSGQTDSSELIEELKDAEYDFDWKRYKLLLKKLQPFTITVRDIDEIAVYLDAVLEGDVYILNKSYYDEKVGLNTAKLETLIL